jgi:hypothetical protein
MKKVSEYLQHAEECQQLARMAQSPEHREMLLSMAATWTSLAKDRREKMARQERLAAMEGGTSND